MFMKKIVSWFLVIVMTAAIAVGGTMAYLTDNDEDVNVLTVGNVKIDQLEYERVDIQTKDDDAIVQEFHNDKPLYPVVTDPSFDWSTDDAYTDWNQIGKNDNSGIWDPDLINNEQDKMVFVKNTGNYDAYVRTVFAFEAGCYTWEEFQKQIHLNVNETDWTWEWIETPVTIGDSSFFLATATYKEPLNSGELTQPSLLQIAMDPSASNDEVLSFGDDYVVLTHSWAIQTEGFDDPDTAIEDGFYVVTTEQHPFKDESLPFYIYNEADFNKFSARGGLGIVMEDFEVTKHATFNRPSTTLDMNGHTIYHSNDANNGYLIRVDYGGELTVTGNGKFLDKPTDVSYPEHSIVFVVSREGSVLTIENGYFDGVPSHESHSVVHAQSKSKVIINGGTFIRSGTSTAGDMIYALTGACIDINGGFFRNDGNYGHTLNVRDWNNSYFNILGGTFVNHYPGSNDPSFIKVPEGYTVTSEEQEDGKTWYTVVPVG